MESDGRKVTLDCRVDSYRSGWTVVDFLCHRFRYHPASRWARRVDDGRVRVNGAVVPRDHRVIERDVVSYTIFHNEPDVDFRYGVVYEDDDILAVSKSGNIPVHACGVYIRNTLITCLKNRYGDHINLAHRLDRETSGLVLLSKHARSARELGRMFAAGEVGKSYLAVVHGDVAEERFAVDAPIGKTDDVVPIVGDRETMRGVQSELKEDLPRFVPRRRIDFRQGKPAKTEFRVVGRGDTFTVLHAAPLSGRTNQIRVHLHYIGHPIVGDKVYLPAPDSSVLPKPGRHALHCRALRFEHPISGKPLHLHADVPDDLRGFFPVV